MVKARDEAGRLAVKHFERNFLKIRSDKVDVTARCDNGDLLIGLRRVLRKSRRQAYALAFFIHRRKTECRASADEFVSMISIGNQRGYLAIRAHIEYLNVGIPSGLHRYRHVLAFGERELSEIEHRLEVGVVPDGPWRSHLRAQADLPVDEEFAAHAEHLRADFQCLLVHDHSFFVGGHQVNCQLTVLDDRLRRNFPAIRLCDGVAARVVHGEPPRVRQCLVFAHRPVGRARRPC